MQAQARAAACALGRARLHNKAIHARADGLRVRVVARKFEHECQVPRLHAKTSVRAGTEGTGVPLADRPY
jgi:hypothetical protein